MDSPGKQMADRLRANNPNNLPVAMGIAWYKPATYAKCLAIFNDAADLPDSFDSWFLKARALEQDLLRQGLEVIRVEIDPDTFPAWCAANGYTKLDKDARMHYGNLKAMEFATKKPK
ncbi:MAG: hypothetical protein WD669_02765 [Pirellulales bacterium]